MKNKNLLQRIEEAIERGVGEFPKVYGIDVMVSKDMHIDAEAYKAGYNQALADIRTRIPSVAEEVLEIVRDELKQYPWYSTNEDIIASLAGDGDNGTKI